MLLPTLLNRVETHRQANKAWLSQSGNRVVRAWEAVKLQKISVGMLLGVWGNIVVLFWLPHHLSAGSMFVGLVGGGVGVV